MTMDRVVSSPSNLALEPEGGQTTTSASWRGRRLQRLAALPGNVQAAFPEMSPDDDRSRRHSQTREILLLRPRLRFGNQRGAREEGIVSGNGAASISEQVRVEMSNSAKKSCRGATLAGTIAARMRLLIGEKTRQSKAGSGHRGGAAESREDETKVTVL